MVQQAILVGIFLSFIDYAYSSSENIQLLEIRINEKNELVEQAPPQKLADNSITVLFHRGNAYFAAMRTLQDQLPDAKNAQRAVVIFRMRDRDEVGSTFIRTIERYTRDLQDHGNILMIASISQDVMEQLERTELLDLIGEKNIFLGQARFGAALGEAVAAAEAWMAQSTEVS